MSNDIKTIHTIINNYILATGKLIAFLVKKCPNNINLINAKNLFMVAKNNESVFFSETHQIILDYHKEIAAGTKEALLNINFENKLNSTDKLKTDQVTCVREVILEIITLLKEINTKEWEMVSRLLKDLLSSTSQYKLLVKKNEQNA